MVKLPFPRQSDVILNISANADLPEHERVYATILWPTLEEAQALPELVYVDRPYPTQENPNGTAKFATDESLVRFAAHVLVHHVPKIGNLEGVEKGVDLLAQPKDNVAEIVWAIIIAFRAGPGAILEKKKGS